MHLLPAGLTHYTEAVTAGLRNLWKKKVAPTLLLSGARAEAMFWLLVSRLAVRLCFRRIAPWALTMRRPEDPRPPTDLEWRCGRAVDSGIRLLGWRDSCLISALAVKIMLARRGYRSTIHLGAGHKGTGDLYAHAWIDAGGQIITGERQLHTVTPIVREPNAG